MLINNQYYFIHIPRTGGRYIEQLFANNNYTVRFHDYEFIFREHLKRRKVEAPHFEYPYFFRLTDKKNLETFTVVRDPVTRFASLLRAIFKHYNIEMNQEIIAEIFKEFTFFVNRQIMHWPNNWFIPQTNFVSFETKIWHYENGLEEDFLEWLKDNFGFTFKIFDFERSIAYYDDNDPLEFTKDQINIIKNYYYKDYKVIYG